MLLLEVPSYILNRNWHWVLWWLGSIIADFRMLCSSLVLWLKSATCRIGYRNIVLFLFHYENISAGDFENINIRFRVTISPVSCSGLQHSMFNTWINWYIHVCSWHPHPPRENMWHKTIIPGIYDLCNRFLITSHQPSPLPNLLSSKVWMWMFNSKFWFVFGIQIQTTCLALGRKQRKW